jgi:hypothetical protein
MKTNEFVDVLKANQKMVACWGVAIVLVIMRLGVFHAQIPARPPPTSLRRPQWRCAAPTPTPVAPAAVVTTRSQLPSISITSASPHNNSGAMDEYQYMPSSVGFRASTSPNSTAPAPSARLPSITGPGVPASRWKMFAMP